MRRALLVLLLVGGCNNCSNPEKTSHRPLELVGVTADCTAATNTTLENLRDLKQCNLSIPQREQIVQLADDLLKYNPQSDAGVVDANTDAGISPTPPGPPGPTSHPRIYLPQHAARLKAAISSAAGTRLRTRTDQWVGGADIWGFQAWTGALLGQLTGDPKYCAKSVAVVEAQVKAAETKIASGNTPEVAGDSYLQIGELVGDLALVYDWCNAKVTDAQKKRWISYANQAVWNVWNFKQATWGGKSFPWTGWSVDNPSNNYHYSFLRATMLLGLATRGENDQADAWLAVFKTKMATLAQVFDRDLIGGGSREGTGYGVAMRKLFELYILWESSTGEIISTKTQHTRASLLAFMHQVMPTLDRVAPLGDHSRDSTASFFDYHRDYLQELIALFPKDPLAGRAKTMLDESSVKSMENSFMFAYDFINDTGGVPSLPYSALNTTYYARGLGHVYTRSGWDKTATWFALIGGPYTESHAHQDQGSILLYKGNWLAHDAVVHSKSGLPQATTAHSLVRVDSGGQPVRQIASTVSKFLALRKAPNALYAAVDVTPAYNGNPAIQRVQREAVLLYPNTVVVFDRVQSLSTTTQVWQLVVPVLPTISGNTANLTNAGHSLKVIRVAGGAAFSPSPYDFRKDSDFTGGWRLDEAVPGGSNTFLHVLSIDNSVTAVDASGPTGAKLTMADGTVQTVTFHPATAGTVSIAAGTTVTLVPGFDTLPE